jgi:1,4-alpha-glucan branching enzyme
LIRRQHPNQSGQVKVTFSLPVDGPGLPVNVIGDFNDWNPSTTRMRRRGDRQSVTIALDSGGRYAFRYRDRVGTWFNDDTADELEDNGLGGLNSIIDLSDQQ